MKSLCGIVLACLIAVVGCGGGGEEEGSKVKEIKTESMQKTGDTWKVAFTSEIAAPVDKVWAVMKQPEKGHDVLPENVLKSELKSEEGNKKVVDLVLRLDILPPGFKVQNPLNEFTYHDDEHRIEQKTLDFKLADINSEFRLKPSADGKSTLVEFNQTSKDKASMIVESLQKGALRETYVIQIKQVEKALGIDTAPKAG